MYIAFDRDFAFTLRLPVRLLEYILMFFISVCVVLTLRLIGIMLLMSMITVPQNTAELFCSRFSRLMFLSAIISIVGGLSGLFLAYRLDVPASACIIFVLVLMYAIARFIAFLRDRRL